MCRPPVSVFVEESDALEEAVPSLQAINIPEDFDDLAVQLGAVMRTDDGQHFRVLREGIDDVPHLLILANVVVLVPNPG